MPDVRASGGARCSSPALTNGGCNKGTNNTVIRIFGKEPTFRFFKSTNRYIDKVNNDNVINVDVNEIFSKDYDTFETAYLDICTKLNITPQINRVRAFILLWLERQERYKKLLA